MTVIVLRARYALHKKILDLLNISGASNGELVYKFDEKSTPCSCIHLRQNKEKFVNQLIE